MPEDRIVPFPIVDAMELDPPVRDALLPEPELEDETGRKRQLPRYFFEIPSWDAAIATQLVEHFTLAELMRVDVREAPAVRDFPRYVPCTVTALAAHLELLRRAADLPVYIAANGGYRSPAHRLTRNASTHCWGTAANVYRIGDEYLDSRESIEKWNAVVARSVPGSWTRPYGRRPGCADDHVHLDLGYVVAEPRGRRNVPDSR